MSKRRRIFVHYGSDSFDPSHQYKPYWSKTKPVGLWASSVKAEYGWKDWCESECFHTDRLEKSFRFTLKKDAKILQVHKETDILPYVKRNKILAEVVFNPFGSITDSSYELDLEHLYSEYDGMELFITEDWNNFHYGMFNLWDCDSICIWNLKKIKPLES